MFILATTAGGEDAVSKPVMTDEQAASAAVPQEGSDATDGGTREDKVGAAIPQKGASQRARRRPGWSEAESVGREPRGG